MQPTVTLRSYARYAALGTVGMIGISCYILADTFFVARGLGAAGLAALNLAIPAFSLMNGIGLMLGVGGATRYAICRAQQDDTGADRVFTHAAAAGLVAGLLFLCIGLLFSAPLARLLGADADTFALTQTYLRTLLCFGPFFLMNNILLAFVRNDGAPSRAMCGMVVGSLSNIVFDYLFIFPFGLGIFGAALATGISPLISMAIQSGHLRSGKHGFHLRRTKPCPGSLPALCAPGVSSLIGELSSGLVLFLFNLVLLRLAGNTGVAAYGIVANLALVAVSIYQGLSTGTQPLISHSSGTGDRPALRRLLRWSCVTAFAIAAALYAAVLFFAAPITAVFNSEGNVRLATYAVSGMRIYFIGFLFAGINIVAAAFFSASDRTGQGFFLSLLRGIFALVPLLFLLTALFGLNGVWATFPAAEAITLLCTAVCIRRNDRQK